MINNLFYSDSLAVPEVLIESGEINEIPAGLSQRTLSKYNRWVQESNKLGKLFISDYYNSPVTSELPLSVPATTTSTSAETTDEEIKKSLLSITSAPSNQNRPQMERTDDLDYDVTIILDVVELEQPIPPPSSQWLLQNIITLFKLLLAPSVRIGRNVDDE